MKYDATQALHKYLHDEGVWPDDDGPVWPSGDHDWHMRVCEGITALANQPTPQPAEAVALRTAIANALADRDNPEGWTIPQWAYDEADRIIASVQEPDFSACCGNYLDSGECCAAVNGSAALANQAVSAPDGPEQQPAAEPSIRAGNVTSRDFGPARILHQPAAEGLDVERLTRFLVTITDDTDGDWAYPGSRRELAREIVEYANQPAAEPAHADHATTCAVGIHTCPACHPNQPEASES